jgi:hypothetical protein
VIEVLEPFEVRNSDTTTIKEEIWADSNTSLDKDFLTSECGWSVGTFNYYLALEFDSVILVD